jgi:hypothetical protein
MMVVGVAIRQIVRDKNPIAGRTEAATELVPLVMASFNGQDASRRFIVIKVNLLCALRALHDLSPNVWSREMKPPNRS